MSKIPKFKNLFLWIDNIHTPFDIHDEYPFLRGLSGEWMEDEYYL